MSKSTATSVPTVADVQRPADLDRNLALELVRTCPAPCG
jgi:hypothetical protein